MAIVHVTGSEERFNLLVEDEDEEDEDDDENEDNTPTLGRSPGITQGNSSSEATSDDTEATRLLIPIYIFEVFFSSNRVQQWQPVFGWTHGLREAVFFSPKHLQGRHIRDK